MPTYDRIPDDHDARTWLTEVVAAHHPELAKAKVTIGLLFAYADKDKQGVPKGPAIKLRGHACHAVGKINSYEDRVQGLPDATITLDGDHWTDWDEAKSRAILDHECTHLNIIPDEDAGGFKEDDAGRPKIKMRLHDWEVGWFADVARRHGDASVEVQQAKVAVAVYRQQFFPFVRIEDGRISPEPAPRPKFAVAGTA